MCVVFDFLLNRKEENWNSFKLECTGRMTELSEYFSGEKALTRVDKDENLQEWFKGLGGKIEKLDYTKSVQAGRKVFLFIYLFVCLYLGGEREKRGGGNCFLFCFCCIGFVAKNDSNLFPSLSLCFLSH